MDRKNGEKMRYRILIMCLLLPSILFNLVSCTYLVGIPFVAIDIIKKTINRNDKENEIIKSAYAMTSKKCIPIKHNNSQFPLWSIGINSLLLTPDESRIITSDTAGRIKVWDLKTGNLLSYFISPHKVNEIIIDPTGNYLVANGFVSLNGLKHGWFTIFDLTKKTIIKTSSAHESLHRATPIDDLVITNDSNYLITGNYNEIRIWDLKSGKLINEFNINIGEDMLDNIAVHPENKYIYFSYNNVYPSSYNSFTTAINFNSGEIVRRIKTEFLIENLISISNEEVVLVFLPSSDTFNSKSLVWNIAINDSFLIGENKKKNRILFSNVYENLLILGTDKLEFEIWDLKNQKQTAIIPFKWVKNIPKLATYKAILTKDKKYIVIGTTLDIPLSSHSGGNLILWNIEKNKKVYNVNSGTCF